MDNCENPQYISPEDVVEAMPFEKGDSILVASDVSEFLMAAFLEGKHFDLDHLIDLIQEKLTSDGTLLFPTYNWKFCSGKVFDYHKTKSRTGALSQKALKRPDFVRTTHPLYSFAVWGKDAEYLHSLQNINSFVGGTPFEYLNDTKQSKMLMLDVDSRCFTFQHYVEERVHAPYRYLKKFTAPYIDENGNESIRTATMYVRYLHSDLEALPNVFEKALIANGSWKKLLKNGHEINMIRFADAYDFFSNDIRYNGAKSVESYDSEKLSRERAVLQDNEIRI